MEGYLRIGKNLKALLALRDSGRDVPMLDNIPMLTPDESFYLKAFQDLNSCRQRAAGTEPISVQEIYFYCKLNGITGQEEVLDIFSMVKHQDEVFMAWNEKAAKKG